MAHGFLSYQDPRGEVDYLDKIYKAIRGYLDKRDKREEKAERNGGLVKSPDPFDDGGPVEPAEIAVDSPKTPPANLLKRAIAGSALRRALPSAAATPTEVRGGALARSMGFAGNRVKPEGFVADQIIDINATPVNDSNEIVAAIDRLTFVSMNLLSAQKEQNAIAQRQQLFFEKLARKDKARLEESELERAKDLSGNIAYKKSALQSGRGPAGLLGPGPGPGAGGGGRRGADTGDIVRGAGQFLTNKSAYKAGGSLYKAGSSLLSGTNVVKNIPEVATTTVKNIEKVKSPVQVVSNVKKLITSGAAFMGKSSEVSARLTNSLLGNKKTFVKKQYGPGAPGLGNIVEIAAEVDAKDAKPLASIRKQLSPGSGLASLGDDGLAMITNSPDVLNALDKADDISDGAATAKTLATAADAGATKAGLLSFLRGRKPKGLVRGSALTRMMLKNRFGKEFLKKLPLIGAVAGIVFAAQRLMEGDYLGAGLELGSGLLGATGLAPASVALDGLLLARDFGAVPFAKGGIITQPTAGLVGEAGTEGVFPLEGTKGKKTFAMFGDGIIDAQKRRKKEVAQIQAEGLKLFSEDAQYMKVFDLFNPFKWRRDPENPEQPNNGNGRAWWDPLGVFTGKNNGAESRTPMVGPPPPLPPITGTDSVSMARSLIVDKEGFEETPYWDVNAYRAGYGSDTYTLADGTVKRVQRGVNITRADADRDIDRRISTEFMPEARRAVGPDIWDNLPAAAQAALTSIAYNYGSVPERVTRVAKSTNGNIEAIAGAVEGLKGDNKGINAGRRQHEADMIRSSAGQAAASLTPSIGDQSMIPGAPETGNPLSIASQQVANAGLATQTPTIINNYYSGGSQTGGNMPADVAFGVSSGDMGNSWASELRLRTV